MIDFEENMRLVPFVFNKFFRKYKHIKEDLLQEGYIALFKCCKKFSQNQGFAFSSYAVKGIKNNMLLFLVRNERQTGHAVNFGDIEEWKLESIASQNDCTEIVCDIKNTLKRLNNRDRAVCLDFFFTDKKGSEIVKKHGISQSTVTRITLNFKNEIKEMQGESYGR